ncbi:MAG TPA: DUF2784 domain-containing protein [Candidatus Binatia bacterium]|nr:DUF2784 domain-containing protein [Candidatus Binatia bacterium]
MIAAQTFYRLLADLVVLVHFAFVLFVIFGGFWVARQRRVMPFHLAAAIWAAFIEFSGWICPLTPLENQLRQKSGSKGYQTDFVVHYILPILYPEGLTRETQIALGTVVIVINLGIYGWILRYKSGRNAD